MVGTSPRIVRRSGRWREEFPDSAWRWILAPVTVPVWAGYTALVQLRNALFSWGWTPCQRLPVPVVSIGNITAGGTGKTPAVIAVCAMLRQRGWNPAVLSRGYRGDGQTNDEALLLGSVPVVCNPDRVAGGRQAIAAGADCLVLDDGAQHRRLHRDCNIILIDVTRPGSACLPLGWLREPWSGLQRAHLVWLSRAELAGPTALARLESRLPHAIPILRDVHRDGGVRPLGAPTATQPATVLCGRPLILASGLGNPQGFERAAQHHGWNVLESWRFPDHHRFCADDAAALTAAGQRCAADLVITAKDAVKLAPFLNPATTWVLAAGDGPDEHGLATLALALDPHFPNRT